MNDIIYPKHLIDLSGIESYEQSTPNVISKINPINVLKR